jgi:hypothetical protein
VLSFGIQKLMKNSWSMSGIWYKSKDKDSIVQFFLTLMNKLLKLIYAIRLEQQFKQSRLDYRWQFLGCLKLILWLVLKVTFICGNIKVKHQDLQCLNLLLKLDIEKWEDKFAGLSNKNLISIKYMILINLIILKKLRISFVL